MKYKLSANITITAVDNNDTIPPQFYNKYILRIENSEREFLINNTIKYFIDKFSVAKTTTEVIEEVQRDVKSTSGKIEETCSKFFHFFQKNNVLVPEHTAETPNAAEPLFSEGDRIDQFCIESVLSLRQYTELYVATDTTNDIGVVIKLLNRKKTGDKSTYNQELFELEREYSMLKNVRHIPQVSQAFAYNKQHEEYVYITLEYIRGKSLSHYFDGEAKPSRVDSLNIINQILDGFSSLHNSNFIHGDVHASNILVTEDKTIKLIDLGLSRKVDFEETEIVSFGGVDFYMPPERINVTSIDKHTKEPDLYSDVYQIGILIYFILYNRLPFDGFTWEELATSIKETNAVYPTKSYSKFQVPDKLVQIIEKCIDKTPANRYKNAGEILADFKKLGLKKKEQVVN